MSPALTTITPTTDDEARQTCSSCMGELSDMALKCNKCQRHVHLRCSGMPEYQLARLAVSQVHFMCASCVKSKDFDEEDHYNAEITKMREIIAKEISIIDQLNKDANSSIATSDTSVLTINQDPVNKNPLNENTASSSSKNQNMESKPICKYFKTKSCKHGAKGVGCSFKHPQKCLKYLRHGSKGNQGCKKGAKRDRYHPKLCFNSANGGYCEREGCTMQIPSSPRHEENKC